MLRPKQRLGDFFLNAFDFVKQMSINDKAERIFTNPKELITPTEINDGWQWLLRYKEKSVIIQIEDYYYMKSEKKGIDRLVDKAREFKRKQNNFKDFTFDEHAKLKSTVHELTKAEGEGFAPLQQQRGSFPNLYFAFFAKMKLSMSTNVIVYYKAKVNLQ